MELGTFGAVMSYASRIVMQSVTFYETAYNVAHGPELRSVLRSLSDDGRRDQATMELARRENVTEMILEPIVGLDQHEYEAIIEEPVAGPDAAILRMALVLAERDCRFFTDSSARLPLPEVARIFRRVAQRKEKAMARLRALAG